MIAIGFALFVASIVVFKIGDEIDSESMQLASSACLVVAIAILLCGITVWLWKVAP